MTASRAKGPATALLAALLAAPAAWGQEPAHGRPLILTSPNLEQSAPAAAESAPTESAFPGGGKSTGPRFEVEELKAPDPDSMGVLDESHGGLGREMWRGTSAETVRRLIPALPAASGSHTLQELTRRLLLSAAAAPEGNRGRTPPLLELRAERLAAMGDAEGLASLLKTVPASIATPGLSQLRLDTALAAGDAKSACAEAALAQTADPRLAIFCKLSNGQTLEANMALDLMRERKDADHAFIAAAEAMAGTPPAKVDKLPNATALHLAAFRAAKLPLPADAAAAAPPALLKAIIDNVANPVDMRLLAAERAESLGILDAEALRKLMAGVTFTPAEQQAAQAQGDKTPRGRALWLKAVEAEAMPGPRADLIVRVLAHAAERKAFAQTARLYAPLMADLKPAPETAGAAAVIARALYAAGRNEAAETWLGAVKADPAGAKAAAALWPLARLARIGLDPAPGNALSAWQSAAQPGERQALVTLVVLQAVGEPVPAAAWAAHAGATFAVPAAKPALAALLRSAAENGHRGEAVLAVAVALGEGGPETADPDLLGRSVAALRQVGLEREARQLAIEAVLAAGG